MASPVSTTVHYHLASSLRHPFQMLSRSNLPHISSNDWTVRCAEFSFAIWQVPRQLHSASSNDSHFLAKLCIYFELIRLLFYFGFKFNLFWYRQSYLYYTLFNNRKYLYFQGLFRESSPASSSCSDSGTLFCFLGIWIRWCGFWFSILLGCTHFRWRSPRCLRSTYLVRIWRTPAAATSSTLETC